MKTIRSFLPKTTIWWAFGLLCGDATFANLRESSCQNHLWQTLGWFAVFLGFGVGANIVCDLVHGFDDAPDNIPNSKEP